MKYTNEERLEYLKTHNAMPGDVSIGKTALIHRTAVIGMDGFGWVRDGDFKLIPMPHMHGVVIENDVTIRAFVTIDRGVSRDTVIGEGTKIDHHCHIAHGAKIGKHNTLAAGCIIEGSCEIGDFNTFGAGVIVQTKVKVGNNCIFGSGCVVTKDAEDNSVMIGNPARLLRKNA